MSSTAPSFPQEIIEAIIDNLHGDVHTLNKCTLVSRQFCDRSRKHQLSIIHFDHPHHTQRLYNLILNPHPETARYIKKIFLGMPVTGVSWFIEDEYVPRILRASERLQLLSVKSGFPPGKIIHWSDYPEELQSALIDRFRSPDLISLELWRCPGRPMSLIGSLTQLRELTANLNDMHDDTNMPALPPPPLSIDLSRLEALELRSRGYIAPTTMFSNIEKLLFLSIQTSDQYTLEVAQDVVRRCAGTIRLVSWSYLYPRSGSETLSLAGLGAIKKLHYLYLSIGEYPGHRSTLDLQLSSLIRCLNDHGVTKALKEVTLAIDCSWMRAFLSGDGVLKNIYGLTEWSTLDSVLSGVWTLERVLITIQLACELCDGALTSFLQLLPRLLERGILLVRYGDAKDMQGAAWDMYYQIRHGVRD